MNQDEKMVLLIVQESLIEGDASPARQKELAEMLERVISGGLTPRAADGDYWICLWCKHDNSNSIQKCGVCGTPRK